ncbi:MAG: SGNH/GDSL hydrolase family protein [Candidatus Eisenbacteria bacterium]
MVSSPGPSEFERPARIPLWKNVLFAVFVCVCTLALIEAGTRLLVPSDRVSVREEHEDLIRVLGLPDMIDLFEPDPDLFWRLKPNVRGRKIEGTIGRYAVSFAVSTNEIGLRSRPVPREKCEFRVLVLGNSCTFGIGVDDEETLPARLEQLLRGRTGADVLVMNASVPGYSAYQGKRFLETRGFRLRPDLVIASFGFNDASAWSSRSDMQVARALAAGKIKSPLRASRAYGVLRTVVAGGRGEGPPVEAEKRPRLSSAEFHRTLVEIRDLCADRNVPVLFLVWPFRKQMEERDNDLLAYQQVVAAAGAGERIPVLNLVDPFLEAGGDLFVDNLHANAKGCRVAAEAIAGVLR